jgi:hypothetical protein
LMLFLTACTSEVAPKTALVQVSCPPLASLDDNRREVLLRHFRMSEKWTVEGSAPSEPLPYLFASRRYEETASFPGSPHFKVWFKDSGRQRHGSPITQVSANAGLVPVTLGWGGTDTSFKSALRAMGGAGVFVEILEMADGTAREGTQQAYYDVCQQIRDALAGAPVLPGSGLKSMAPTDDSRKTAQVSAFEIRSSHCGRHTVVAWLNPMEDGWTTVRVLTLQAIPGHPPLPAGSELPIPFDGRYTGWSSDPSERFRYQSSVWTTPGLRSESYPVRFELWFHPVQGSPRRLTAKELSVCGWE